MADQTNSVAKKSRPSHNKRGGYAGPSESKPPTSYQKPAPTPPRTSKPSQSPKK
jgi:hypothetical protein